MWCPKCGAQIADGSKFCPKCGYKIVIPQDVNLDDTRIVDEDEFDFKGFINEEKIREEERLREEERQREEQRLEYERRQRAARSAAIREAQEKKNKKIIITGIIIAVAIAAAGIAAFFWINSFAGNSQSSSSSSGSTGQVQLTPSATATPIATPTPEATATPEPVETATPTPTPTATPTPTEEPQSSGVVTASVMNASSVSASGYDIVGIRRANATSQLVQDGGYDNSANAAVDGDEITSWQEGVDGDGLGEALYFVLDDEYDIRYINFKLGNWRDTEKYNKNNRPKELNVIIGDEEFTVRFPDGKTEYCMMLSDDVTASSVYITIESVYKGTEWDDTCISEVEIYGK